MPLGERHSCADVTFVASLLSRETRPNVIRLRLLIVTLANRFDPRANGLNFLRLLLAAYRHSLAFLSAVWEGCGFGRSETTYGRPSGRWFFRHIRLSDRWQLAKTPQDMELPRIASTRIFPGFLVCLLVTASVIAPVGLILSGESFPENYCTDAAGYVLKNASLNMLLYDIAGTPQNVPYPTCGMDHCGPSGGNFSATSECYHSACSAFFYTERGSLSPSISAAVLLLAVVTFGLVSGDTCVRLCSARRHVLGWHSCLSVQGSSFWTPTVAVLELRVVAGSLFIEGYQIIAAPFLAYALIFTGGIITSTRLRLGNDISYGIYIYAWPIAQVLAGVGLARGPVLVFALATLVLTIPLATASWVLRREACDETAAPSPPARADWGGEGESSTAPLVARASGSARRLS